MKKGNNLNTRVCVNCSCNIDLVILILGFFVVNSFILLAANLLFPEYVVLGTACLSKYWSVIHSMGTLSLVNVLTTACDGENKRMRNFVINLITVWVIGRLADDLGMGVSSWAVVVFLSLFLNAGQKRVISWVKEISEE